MRIGIDLGGTKIEGLVLQGNDVLARRRVATPAQRYEATIEAIARLVEQLELDVQCSPLPVGLGHPGSLCPQTGLLRNANSTCLNGRPLKQDLQERLQRNIAMANDANCLALSELHDGAAQGVDSAFLVIIGTGVGGAVVQHGRLVSGANGLAGEWGHNPLPWMEAEEFPGPVCWCGKNGCLEAFLSGPGLSAHYAATCQESITPPQILERAGQGDALARQMMDVYANRLARALAGIINCLDPRRIVLAGGMSKLEYLYDVVPKLWLNWVFADAIDTELVPAQHGDASGVFGAARLE